MINADGWNQLEIEIFSKTKMDPFGETFCSRCVQPQFYSQLVSDEYI